MSIRYVFVLKCNLIDDTPLQVIDTLKYMTRTEDYEFNNAPDAGFFKRNIWRDFIRVSPEQQSSRTYTGDIFMSFRRDVKYVQKGISHYVWTLYIKQFLYQEQMQDYICFANWLAEYAEEFGFVGYFHSHEEIEHGDLPAFLYAANGKLKYVDSRSHEVFTISDRDCLVQNSSESVS